MNAFKIKVKTAQQKKQVLAKLKEIKGVEVEENPNMILPSKNIKHNGVLDLFGMWADRDIDAKKLREKEWERKK